ncbi:hypothetical protein Fmac_021480 [Flemingia macrophylla]|uniref:Uncharacterized protein n=1 Tax=Flemingia macrophylla TaxID=520843 RepID=A0ABD1LXJ6_9FABA
MSPQFIVASLPLPFACVLEFSTPKVIHELATITQFIQTSQIKIQKALSQAVTFLQAIPHTIHMEPLNPVPNGLQSSESRGGVEVDAARNLDINQSPGKQTSHGPQAFLRDKSATLNLKPHQPATPSSNLNQPHVIKVRAVSNRQGLKSMAEGNSVKARIKGQANRLKLTQLENPQIRAPGTQNLKGKAALPDIFTNI